MTDISRAALFGRLKPTAMAAIEAATGFCRMRGNPYVELTHWLHILVQDPRNDTACIRAAFSIDGARLAADMVAALDRLPRGASAVNDFAPQIEEAIERGWMYTSLLFGGARVRSGYLLCAMLKTPTLRGLLLQISGEWRKVAVDRLGSDFAGITRASGETAGQPDAVTPDAATMPAAEDGDGALARYSIDLTARARAGEIDPIVGRDAEIRQVIDILLRRRQNNPILTGEAGVGKTANVEGFVRRIVDGDVPPRAGRRPPACARHRPASGRGRGEGGIREAAAADHRHGRAFAAPDHPVHRQAHTLIGAGGHAGTGDAANLLKLLWHAGASVRSRRPPGPSIASISRRTRRSPGASRRLRSTNPI